MTETIKGQAWTAAQALFKKEGLSCPHVPPHLASSLQADGTVFSTRPLPSSPYDIEHFLMEIEAEPGLPDYAVVGFAGHGTNSWAMHHYVVDKGLALFIQLPWGGAYLDPEPARQEISEMARWAMELQGQLDRANGLRKIPAGVRLLVAASRLGPAGWHWLVPGQDNAAAPWNPAEGMKAAILQEVDDVIRGKRVLP